MDAHANNEITLLDAFLAHRHTLINAVMPIVGCRYWAEDVVQDTYLKLNDVSGQASIKQPLSYLFRMVRNLAIDRSRRLALEGRHRGDPEAALTVVASDPTPEQVAVDQDMLSRIDEALAELPERTRKAFEMYRIGGCTQQQVAEALGVSPTLVNFLIRDALTHCRDRLQDRGH